MYMEMYKYTPQRHGTKIPSTHTEEEKVHELGGVSGRPSRRLRRQCDAGRRLRHGFALFLRPRTKCRTEALNGQLELQWRDTTGD